MDRGSPYPLGCFCSEHGVNFALYSAYATAVELITFDSTEQQTRYFLPARTGNVWHGLLPDQRAGLRYGFRVYGPWDPDNGFLFNHKKLLIDPYSYQLDKPLPIDESLSIGIKAPDERDTASVMAKSVVTQWAFDWQDDRHPDIPWSEAIIYEAHVKGLTKNNSAIPEKIRGSYAAIAHPVMIDHFKSLGITTLELLPVQQHGDEHFLIKRGLTNYWGYNIVAPFALEPDYASSPLGELANKEFCSMVKTLHQENIEVILDVVFNHTAELDKGGPTYAFRGIDNLSYYWLTPSGMYQNWAGCGNTLKLSQPIMMQYVLDCLRHWRSTYHVDGFRFDLGCVLGRMPDFNDCAPLLSAMRQDPILAQCKLIVEPWDLGPEGYQLGQYSPPFRQWNDRFRDDLRRFWLLNQGTIGNLATRLAGSSDVFSSKHCPAHTSINFMTSHDGFTLEDLVSFRQKHNQMNGESNRDGVTENFSNNHGVEGYSDDEHVNFRRQCSKKGLLALLFLSHGVPMLLAGDELGNKQEGNNNVYCQDNFLSWIDWQQQDKTLFEYVKALIELRKKIASFSWQENWHSVADKPEQGFVQWLNKEGEKLAASQWQQEEIRTLFFVLANKWFIGINSSFESQQFRLPEGDWHVTAPFGEQECVLFDKLGAVSARCIFVLERYR